MIRFAAYDVKLYHRYKTKINTVALCLNPVSRSNCSIDAGSFAYKVQVVDMSERDGDAKLNELLMRIKTGAMVNELELIFLPLMKSSMSKEKLLKEVVNMEKVLVTDWEIKEKIIALTLVLSNKFMDRKILESIWEEIKMFKFIEFAEEKGMEKGIEKGMEKGKTELLLKQIEKKFKVVPEEYKEKIIKLDQAAVDVLAMDILEMKDISELRKYLN
jgi:hypothetical protein